MNPYAQTMRCHICYGKPAQACDAMDKRPVCQLHAHAGYPVVESASEQRWADFCGTLDKPVFLLANTGFGDLV